MCVICILLLLFFFLFFSSSQVPPLILFFSIHTMWSHPLSLPSSSSPPPHLKYLLWFCFFLYTQCDLILCPFFFIFFIFLSSSQVPPLILFFNIHTMWSLSSLVPSSSSSSQVPPLILFFSIHTMWSLSSYVPCVKMINTKLSSPSSDFCFFFLYTQCDLSHPLSLVSKWSIQEVPT